MTWFLTALAETWRQRWHMGLPMLIGAAVAVAYTLCVPPTYEARVLLQVQDDSARPPLLANLDAPGQRNALFQILSNPDLLADTGKDAGRKLNARDLVLTIVNNHLISIGYRSSNPQGLEQLNDGLAYNFIQALMAPERTRIEQMLAQNQQELRELSGRLATSDGIDAATRGQLTARQKKLQDDVVQMQTDLRMVNSAFGGHGSQALIWFAEPSSLVAPMDPVSRMLVNILFGAFLGFTYAWVVHELPYRRRKVVRNATHAAEASGMPVVGVLPWLGKVRVSRDGLHVKVQGKALRPADFGEVSRLQRTLLRALRGPLVLLGVSGEEGVSSLTLLLAEKTAALGKQVVLVDMNLKNRTLSQWLGLGDGNWELPTGRNAKSKWSALQPLPGHPGVQLLAAPRHPETLQKLVEAGGLPALFDYLSGVADAVIVDASPLSAMNRGNIDAVAVAAASARTVLVAQADVTTTDDLKRASDSLLLVGAPLLGIVLNKRFVLSQRQLLGQIADRLYHALPPLGRWLRKAAASANLE